MITVKNVPTCTKAEFQLFLESFFKIQRKLCLRGSLSLSLSGQLANSGTPAVHFSFSRGGGWGLFEAGRLLTFPTYTEGGRLFEVGAYSRLGA